MSIHQKTHDSAQRLKRRRLYELQDAAGAILGDGYAVSRCMKQTKASGGGVAVVNYGDHHSFSGVATCQNAWLCPVCSRRIMAARRDEIHKVLTKAHDAGRDALFVTVTIQHHAGDELAPLLDTMLAAWRSVFSGDRSGERQCFTAVAGQIKAVEVRYGASHWHPHLHVIVLLDHTGMTADEAAALDEQIAATIYSRYSRAVERRGMVAAPEGYNCQTIHDLAGAAGRYIQKFEAGLELTAGGAKDGHLSYSIWQLLEMYAKDPNAKVYGRSVAALFKEYATATRGRRQISFSREMRELVKIKEDSEITEETPEVEVVATIEPRLWWQICRRHLRAAVLEAADDGHINEYLDLLRVELWHRVTQNKIL